MYRQGDILLIPVDGTQVPLTDKPLPRDPEGRAVLAYGEVTGHAHAVKADTADLFKGAGRAANDVFLKVVGDAPVDLSHEEHAPISVPPGTYKVVRQKEHDPVEEEAVRIIAD